LSSEVLRELIGPLADFLAGKQDDKPFPPPDELNRRFGQLPGEYCFGSRSLTDIMRGWGNVNKDNPASETAVAEALGEYLCDWLDLKERRCSPNRLIGGYSSK
jgi:hypothetical protein